MKRTFPIVAMLALVLIVGCNATPARRALVSVDAATDAVNGVSAAAELSPPFRKQLPAILPYADAVHAAQTRVLTGIANKDPLLPTYFQALTDAVIELANQKATVIRTPATQP